MNVFKMLEVVLKIFNFLHETESSKIFLKMPNVKSLESNLSNARDSSKRWKFFYSTLLPVYSRKSFDH